MFGKRNIPVLLLVITLSFFSNYSIGQHPVKDSVKNVKNKEPLFKLNAKDKEITFKSNKFTYAALEKKKESIITPSGEIRSVPLPERPHVLTMNGQKIYNISEIKVQSKDSMRYKMLERYLLERLSHYPQLLGSANGTARVNMDDIVIDTTGRIVYYNFTTIIFTDTANKKSLINSGERETDMLFSQAPHVSPGVLNGKKVITRLNISMADYDFEIKKHAITYTKNTEKAQK